MSKYSTPCLFKTSIACNSFLGIPSTIPSQHYDVVLLDVQGRVGLDDDLDLSFALDLREGVGLFVRQQRCDVGVSADDDGPLVGRGRQPPDVAEQLVADRGRVLGVAAPLAVVTGLRERAVEVLPHALP